MSTYKFSFEKFFFFVVALFVFTACPSDKGVKISQEGKAKGRTLTVDNSGDAGYHVAMDLDTEDRVHLAYFDKTAGVLKYVKQTSAGFSTEVVDGMCKRCLFATIRVSGDNEPHIAYYSDVNQTLTYAYKDEGKWRKESIEWGRLTGMGVQLLFDDAGGLHALYYSGDGFLKHAWRTENNEISKKTRKTSGHAKPSSKEEEQQPKGLWGYERLDKANGSEKVQICFTKQPDGRFAASYFSWSGLSSEVRIALQGADGKWKTQLVSSKDNAGKSSALFFDRNGEMKVIFREARKDRLSLAERTSDGWKITPLVQDAYNMALDVDGVFNLILAYEKMSGPDARRGTLHIVTRTDWAWHDFEIDKERGSGSYLAAALTTLGQPVVAYFSESSKSLKLFVGE